MPRRHVPCTGSLRGTCTLCAERLRVSVTCLHRYTLGGAAAGGGGVSDLPTTVPLLGVKQQLPTSQLTSGILDLADNCVDLSPRTLVVDPADGPEDPLTNNIRNVLFNSRYSQELSDFEVGDNGGLQNPCGLEVMYARSPHVLDGVRCHA